MSENLVSKFTSMTDREILIATCLKVEAIEKRIDAHSVENDAREASCLRRYEESLKEQRNIRRIINDNKKASLKMSQYFVVLAISLLGGAIPKESIGLIIKFCVETLVGVK